MFEVFFKGNIGSIAKSLLHMNTVRWPADLEIAGSRKAKKALNFFGNWPLKKQWEFNNMYWQNCPYQLFVTNWWTYSTDYILNSYGLLADMLLRLFFIPSGWRFKKKYLQGKVEFPTPLIQKAWLMRLVFIVAQCVGQVKKAFGTELLAMLYSECSITDETCVHITKNSPFQSDRFQTAGSLSLCWGVAKHLNHHESVLL